MEGNIKGKIEGLTLAYEVCQDYSRGESAASAILKEINSLEKGLKSGHSCVKDKIDTYQECYDLAGEAGMDLWRLRSIILEKMDEAKERANENINE